MNYRKYSKDTLAKSKAYTPWLTQFTKPKGPTSKKPSNPQFYLNHPMYIDKFTKEDECQVEDRGTPTALQLNFCNKIIKDLLSEKPENIQEAMHQENQEAHNELTADYAATLKGAPPVDQEGQDAFMDHKDNGDDLVF